MTITTELATCSKCQRAFEAHFTDLPELGTSFRQKVCQVCIAKTQQESLELHKRTHADDRRRFWKDRCPQEFRTPEEGGATDVARMAKEQPLFAQALQWRYGRRGLLLAGPSGCCKTRIAWRIIRREFDAGRSFKSMKAHQFGVEAVDLQMKGGFRDWFHSLVHTPLLFLDDFGKGRFTDAVESHWFALLDERTERGKPVIVTTNSSSDQLKARMTDDRGEPLIRRLRDYCYVIDFTP